MDWTQREQTLAEFLDMTKRKAREANNPYDCIVPVSGGKDSHYQVHLLKQKYGLNPLLVTFNHAYNTELGVRNLGNMVRTFGCDLIRFTVSPDSARKLSRYMLERVGDLTWHYHAGIRTFPFQVAVKYNIPLIVWGEHGFAELTGMFTLDDMVEFTKWTRQEHDMRGIEPQELVNARSGITPSDIVPYIYPDDEAIEALDLRGIYLSNFIDWNAKEQADFVVDRFNFGIYEGRRERTFALYTKTDDHANDVHDYLKYLKFGYGRCTDDASMEIRHGRMTREEGIDLVRKYDHVKPTSLKHYCDWLGIDEGTFFDWVEPMRDLSIWEKRSDGYWMPNDSCVNHRDDPGVAAARVPLVPEPERAFSRENKRFYFSERWWPANTPLDPNVTGAFRVL